MHDDQIVFIQTIQRHSNVKIKLALIIFSFDTETELLLLRQIPYHLLLWPKIKFFCHNSGLRLLIRDNFDDLKRSMS